jgi:hypothetical protein
VAEAALHIPPALATAWAKAPELTAVVLERRLREAQLLAYREIVERTPVGVGGGGGLRGSIQPGAVSRTGQRLTATIGTALVYAAPVETGSKPHMPPIAPLIDWVEARLGLKGDEAEGVARKIAWKIKRHGTKGKFMFRDGLAATKDQIERILSQAGDEVAARLAGGMS